jgi:hypothetical protein
MHLALVSYPCRNIVLLEDVFLWRVEGGLRTPFLWKRVRSPHCTVWEELTAFRAFCTKPPGVLP